MASRRDVSNSWPGRSPEAWPHWLLSSSPRSAPFSLELGVVLGLKGIAAAVVGGLSSGRATLLGGLALGIGEAILTTLWLPALELGGLHLPPAGSFPAIQDLAVLLALVALLAATPAAWRLGG